MYRRGFVKFVSNFSIHLRRRCNEFYFIFLQDAINVLPQMKSPLSIKKAKTHFMSSVGPGLSIERSSSGNQLGMPEATFLHESSVCRALLTEHFDEVCSNILSQRISRNVYIQQILPKILPRLAAFHREKFIKK